MIRTHLSVEEALSLGAKLPYAYIRRTDGVTLGPAPKETGTAHLLEARWFSDTEEIRIFQRCGELQAVRLQHSPEDASLGNETYPLEKNSPFGTSLTMRRFLAMDEDGQMSVETTCLTGWKGEL